MFGDVRYTGLRVPCNSCYPIRSRLPVPEVASFMMRHALPACGLAYLRNAALASTAVALGASPSCCRGHRLRKICPARAAMLAGSIYYLRYGKQGSGESGMPLVL